MRESALKYLVDALPRLITNAPPWNHLSLEQAITTVLFFPSQNTLEKQILTLIPIFLLKHYILQTITLYVYSVEELLSIVSLRPDLE